LPPPPPLSQGHGNGPFGVFLANDETIQFGYNLAGGQVSHDFLSGKM
jgi:hypothetical protein